MPQITCRYCIQPTAILTVEGERSSQYTCGCCGRAFDLDHPPVARTTQARPQTFALPAIGSLAAIESAGADYV